MGCYDSYEWGQGDHNEGTDSDFTTDNRRDALRRHPAHPAMTTLDGTTAVRLKAGSRGHE